MVKNNITCIYNIVERKKLVGDEEKAIKEAITLYQRAKIYGVKHCVVYYYDFEDKDPTKQYDKEELKKGENRTKEINPIIVAIIGLLVHQYLGESFDRIEGFLELKIPINHLLNVNKLMKTDTTCVLSRQIIKNYLEQ